MTAKIHKEPGIASAIEDLLFETEDELVLAGPGVGALAEEAKSVIEIAALVARLEPVTLPRDTRHSRRQLPRRAVPRRAAMRELLVANPRARAILGKESPDTLTDAEVEAALARLAALDGLPEKND